jgi:ubiquitin-like protein Nedd8
MLSSFVSTTPYYDSKIHMKEEELFKKKTFVTLVNKDYNIRITNYMCIMDSIYKQFMSEIIKCLNEKEIHDDDPQICLNSTISPFKPFAMNDIPSKPETVIEFKYYKTTITISIITLTGKEIPININEDMSIIELKKIIEEKEGIPDNQMRLIHKGIQLEDNRTIGSYKIENGNNVHLVLRLRGGMMHTSSGILIKNLVLYFSNMNRIVSIEEPETSTLFDILSRNFGLKDYHIIASSNGYVINLSNKISDIHKNKSNLKLYNDTPMLTII